MTEDTYFIPTKQQKYEDFSEKEQGLIKHLEILRQLSPALKRKVSALIGDPISGTIFQIGYNKMFETLQDQNCEDDQGETIPYVIHAEEQAAIAYLKSRQKTHAEKLTMYVSYAPCLTCSKITAHTGIHRVVFIHKHAHKFDVGEYSPRAFLERMGIEVVHVTDVPNATPADNKFEKQ